MNVARLGEFINSKPGGSLIILAFTFWFWQLVGAKTPLANVHWDVPIYLYRAKLAVETPLLQSYARHSYQIANQVRQHNWPRDERFPEAYWHFSRFGNSLFLGLLYYLTQDGLRAIVAASWIYTLLLGGALVLAMLLSRSLASLRDAAKNDRLFTIGAWVSLCMYVGSDVSNYLSGNMVSEVPALLLLMSGIVSFVKSVEMKSAVWAAVSGGCAFMLYMVRMESLWSYFTGIGSMLVFFQPRKVFPSVGKIFFITFGSFALFYLLYAWYFFPLADPRLFLQFGKAQQFSPQDVSPLKIIGAGGGLLWLTAALGVADIRRSPIVQFAAFWLALQFVPFIIGAVMGMPSQTRMYSLIMPALMLLSTEGVDSWIGRPSARFVKHGFVIAAIALITISNPVLYQSMRMLPGVWHLDSLRSYITLPKYEKVTYPVSDLFEISQLLYGSEKPVLLLRDREFPQEYVNLIRYFGPRQADVSDIALRSDPTNGGNCGEKLSITRSEPVVFCTDLKGDHDASLRHRRVIFISTRNTQNPSPLHGIPSVLFKTRDLLVTELKPSPSPLGPDNLHRHRTSDF